MRRENFKFHSQNWLDACEIQGEIHNYLFP